MLGVNETKLKEIYEEAARILNLHSHGEKIGIEHLRFWSWPVAFGNTAGYGIGGQMMTNFQALGFDTGYGDGVVYIAGRWKYIKDFRISVGFEV